MGFLAGGREHHQAQWGQRGFAINQDRGDHVRAERPRSYTGVAAGCGWSGIAPVRSTVSATPRMLRCVC